MCWINNTVRTIGKEAMDNLDNLIKKGTEIAQLKEERDKAVAIIRELYQDYEHVPKVWLESKCPKEWLDND